MDHPARPARPALGRASTCGQRRPAHRRHDSAASAHRAGQPRRAARISRPSSARAGAQRSANASASSSRRASPSGRFQPEERALRLRAQTNCGQPMRRRRRGPRRLPRRRARRMVRRRAAPGVPRPPARLPRAMGGPERGQDRRERVGGDLRVRPGRIPTPRHRLCACSGDRRLRRASAALARWRPTRCSHEPGADITWGELHMGTRSMFAAAGFERGPPPVTASGRDADRLR